MIKISFKYKHRKLIILIVLSIIIISSSSFAFFKNKKPNKKENRVIKSEKLEKSTIEKTGLEKEVKNKISVDIKGEVNNPGIYSLEENSRVIDVVEKAGGFTERANTTVINLSKKIIDEMVIIIYSNEEVEDFKKTKELEKEVINKCIQKDENAIVNDACINTNEVATINGKVSINNATIEELMTLPGIGEAKAKEIIEYRNNNNGFSNLEQLMEISGIGESIFAKIKDYITL